MTTRNRVIVVGFLPPLCLSLPKAGEVWQPLKVKTMGSTLISNQTSKKAGLAY